MNYDEKIGRVTDLSGKIQEIYQDICRTDYNIAENKLKQEINNIAKTFTEFLEMSGVLCQYGIEVPQEIILAQLQNLLEAFERKDQILLSDTLQFEIADTLQYYKEILQEMKKEKLLC